MAEIWSVIENSGVGVIVRIRSLRMDVPVTGEKLFQV